MSRVYVEFSGLDHISNCCKSVSSKIEGIQSDFQQTVQRLDWDIRFESDINNTAMQLSRKLESYSKILKSYQCFIENARSEYTDLDQYKKTEVMIQPLKMPPVVIVGPGGQLKFDTLIGNPFKNLGNVGKAIGVFEGAFKTTTWNGWTKLGLDASTTISKIAKDYKNYKKIGPAMGSANAKAGFWKKQFGFNTTGHVSQASSFSSKFYNNLHMETSPYNIGKAFSSLAGKNGVWNTVASWTGVALNGISNAYSNIEKQKASNGKISNERVIAKTVMQTAFDTIITYAGGAIVGSAIAAVTGTVAAPVVVAIATGAIIGGTNTLVKRFTNGKSDTFSEWASDKILDLGEIAGKAVGNAAQKVSNSIGTWFRKLSFA